MEGEKCPLGKQCTALARVTYVPFDSRLRVIFSLRESMGAPRWFGQWNKRLLISGS